MSTEFVGGSAFRGAGWAMVVALAGCASGPQRVALEPGVQTAAVSDVDWESGSVSVEEGGVVVSAQGALLPDPGGHALHPTFWVTIENNREDRIAFRPTDARLVDTFGRQHEPLPMSVDRGGRAVGYALVDPEVRTYVSLHFGWPYYPLYPYPGWFGYPRYSRLRYWRPDPFWALGVWPIWITEVRPRPVRVRAEPVPDRLEFVYRDAKLTYVVVFPEIDAMARSLRLIIPDVGPRADEGREEAIDFELVFEQMHEPDVR